MPNVHIRFIKHSSDTIHATMFTGTARQTIVVQRGFFYVITGVGRDAIRGALEVTTFITAALGFVVPIAEGSDLTYGTSVYMPPSVRRRKVGVRSQKTYRRRIGCACS